MGGVTSRRYLQGKKPSAYFASDVWENEKAMLLKLGFNYQRSLKLFEIYSRIDSENQGKISKADFYTYIGGSQTKFKLRLFDVIKALSIEEGTFLYFLVSVWHYCSLDDQLIGRYIFEIYDPKNTCQIEVPDLESMYKFLYDCDEHDDSFIRTFPHSNQCITKAAFIELTSCSKYKHMIQPALDYRSRLRGKFGGKSLWKYLAAYRRKWFAPFDDAILTLHESLMNIIVSEDRNNKSQKIIEGSPIEEKVRQQKEERHLELEKSFRFINSVREAANNRDEDAAVIDALSLVPAEYLAPDFWGDLEEYLSDCDGRVFTVDEIWSMHECREKMYELYDAALAAEDKYWEEKEIEEKLLTVGVPEDHQLRMQDYLETAEGYSELNRLYVLHTLSLLIDNISKQHKKKFHAHRTQKDIELATAMITINKLNVAVEKREKEIQIALDSGVSLTSIKIVPKETKETVDQLFKVIKKYATKEDIRIGNERAKVDLKIKVKDRAVLSKEKYLAKCRRDRIINRDHLLLEIQEIIGVRSSRWYLVEEESTRLTIYMNIDTLEIQKNNSAFCESCDTLLQKAELFCSNCEAPRSKRNFKYFNELGNTVKSSSVKASNALL